MTTNVDAPKTENQFARPPSAGAADISTAAIAVGTARIQRVEEVRYKLPLAMFGLDDATLDRHWHWLYPRFADANRYWDMIVQCWIAVVDNR